MVFSEKEKKLILNSSTYNIDDLTISLLKDYCDNLVNLRSKISLIEI